MTGYRKLIGVLAVQVKTLEATGLHQHLVQNPVEFARIIPAGKNQQRSESGDTILETDSESYLMSKALSDFRAPGMEKFDWLLQNAGVTGATAGAASGAGFDGGTGYGTGMGGNGGDGGFSAGSSGGFGAGLTGNGPVTPGGGPAGITAVVEGYFNATLMESVDGPQKSYVDLARIIAESRPEVVLASFPPRRREALRKLPPDQMAAEVIEDTAAQWAAKRLGTAPGGPDGLIIEDEIIRVLLRSLQATQVASRLAEKLAEYVREFNIPQTTTERIRGELEWAVVPGKEKTRRFLQFKTFETNHFRRLVLHIQELVRTGDAPTATQLADRYISLITSNGELRVEDLGRLPELIQALGGLRSDFWQSTSSHLCEVLPRFAHQDLAHQQLLNALLAISRVVSKFEQFEIVEAIGTAIQGVASVNPADHEKCCHNALTGLASTQALERILEMYVQKRDEGNLLRTASALLRFSGPAGIGKAVALLEEEKNAANRLALIRLIGRVGPMALDTVRKCLHDERWYVVRNACKLLFQLKDPQMVTEMAPALRHQDERVQKAALDAVRESRDPRRAVVIADALPFLKPQLRDEALSELLFLRDPASIPALERLLFTDPKGNLQVACTQTLAAIPGPEAERALLHVLSSPNLIQAARRMALTTLVKLKSPDVNYAVRQYAESAPNDAMSVEMTKTVGT
jgi:HEAT repeat protein